MTQESLSPIDQNPLLIVLLGPTGSGKTALSIAFAQRFDGEILSCDSVSVYRGMDAGTAKPSPEEREMAPHHLIDIADPIDAMTAGDWARAARALLPGIAARGHLPIVSGGTGLYLRAMLDGLAPLPPRCPELRVRLAQGALQRGGGYLHRLLARLNREAAGRIHPEDQPKLIRAIEIALLAPETDEAASRDPLQGYRVLRIGLDPPRPQLYKRLNERAAAMFTQGLLAETAALQARWGADAQALGALGYREAAAVLESKMPLEEAVQAVQQGHRNYAKRQMTWFRREPDVHWLHGFGDDPAIRAAALTLVANMKSPGHREGHGVGSQQGA